MDLINKFQEIVHIQNRNSNLIVGEFAEPINDQQIHQIEKLIGEPLPPEFISLYEFSNGQVPDSNGLLFGERFINSDEIVRQLKISLSFVKPENKKIINPELSDRFLRQIVDFYIKNTTKRNLLGFKKKWYKIEFQCGIDSYSGPYLYPDINTSENEREIVNIKDYSIISNTIYELYNLEREHYNWDRLEFVVFSNGEYKIERTFYDFDNKIPFTSTPEDAIRKKYFNVKWLPIFSDYGGNYIGIDLDPDIRGIKGQIIIFGRDEENMFVLANSLEEFFDLLLSELKKPGNKLLKSDIHLHDNLKDIFTFGHI